MPRITAIKCMRKTKALGDRQELRKFTTHTVFMNKIKYSRSYCNNNKKDTEDDVGYTFTDDPEEEKKV